MSGGSPGPPLFDSRLRSPDPDVLAQRVDRRGRDDPSDAARQFRVHGYERVRLRNEPEQFSRKVEVRTDLDVVLTSNGLSTHRQAFLDAIRTYNGEGRPARTWPIQFLVRRTAHHVMDHAWEMEDRDLGAQTAP